MSLRPSMPGSAIACSGLMYVGVPSVTPVMVRIAITMRPEARVVFPDLEIPLMLDVGASHAMGRPGGVLNRGMGGLRRRPVGGGQ